MNFIEDKIVKKGRDVKLRFPPNPNFILHIGHAKSIFLNFGLAEKYNGTCNLRFDDTNPTVEKSEYVESIKEDIKWLGFEPTNTYHASDYFDYLYDKAKLLISKGLAYVDDSTSEEIASMKGTPTKIGIDSPFKSRTIEENLELFEKMKSGVFEEGSRTLRANIDMSSPNMILRDPILYRIINKEHHNTGDKWKIYPMYDFAHPLSDYKEGITDSLCTLEFEVHKPLYMWILENCDLENELPEETEFSRLNIENAIMSKRKIRKLVENGYVDGWDDPRLMTIAGLRRRGYTPNSIKDFCEIIGVTRKESMISNDLLEECLRKDLNKNSNRFMGVMDPIKLTIMNWDNGIEYLEIENNPEDELSGNRLVPFTKDIFIERDDFREEANRKYHRLKLGGEVRLKGAYVVKAVGIVKKNGLVTEIKCTYDPMSKSGMSLDRKIKGTIHWVSCDYGVNIPVHEYGKLFNNNPTDNFLDEVNKDSLIINNNAIFEPNIDKDNTVQMMRKGYYKYDNGVFNKTVSLKEGWSE